jgi:hypothetical protein
MATDRYYQLGEAIGLLHRTKSAATADLSYAMTGKLYLSGSGWLLLSVPNGLGHAIFDTLNEPGVEMPLNSKGQYNAHISVMRPEEIEKIGGPDKVTERGHEFAYTLGPLREVTPAGWADMSKCWFVEVKSPDLEKLRKSYGLPAIPDNNTKPFHITVAVRKRNVLRDSDTSVGRSSIAMDPVNFSKAAFSKAVGWEIKKSPIDGFGLFATRDFKPGDVVVSGAMSRHADDPDGRIRYEQSRPSRFVNHADQGNIKAVPNGDAVDLVAIGEIRQGDEMVANYRDVTRALGPGFRYTYQGEPYNGTSTSGKHWHIEPPKAEKDPDPWEAIHPRLKELFADELGLNKAAAAGSVAGKDVAMAAPTQNSLTQALHAVLAFGETLQKSATSTTPGLHPSLQGLWNPPRTPAAARPGSPGATGVKPPVPRRAEQLNIPFTPAPPPQPATPYGYSHPMGLNTMSYGLNAPPTLSARSDLIDPTWLASRNRPSAGVLSPGTNPSRPRPTPARPTPTVAAPAAPVAPVPPRRPPVSPGTMPRWGGVTTTSVRGGEPYGLPTDFYSPAVPNPAEQGRTDMNSFPPSAARPSNPAPRDPRPMGLPPVPPSTPGTYPQTSLSGPERIAPHTLNYTTQRGPAGSGRNPLHRSTPGPLPSSWRQDLDSGLTSLRPPGRGPRFEPISVPPERVYDQLPMPTRVPDQDLIEGGNPLITGSSRTRPLRPPFAPGGSPLVEPRSLAMPLPESPRPTRVRPERETALVIPAPSPQYHSWTSGMPLNGGPFANTGEYLRHVANNSRPGYDYDNIVRPGPGVPWLATTPPWADEARMEDLRRRLPMP